MNVSLAIGDYAVLFLYLAGLLFVGFFLDRKMGKGSDLFLGGRSLKWWQIGFSMFSANAGPTMLIGFAGIGFSEGMVGSNFEWLAWIFILLLAVVFIPLYRSTGISTMPQFLMVRYGNKAYKFLTFYSLVSILVVWLASALYAGGLLISQMFGWGLIRSMVSVAIVATSFTTLGGLKAVMRTGIFQSSVILLSSGLLLFFALRKAGGIHQAISVIPHHYLQLLRPASSPSYSWISVLVGYPVVAIYYWCADQTIVQKVLAGKNVREGQYGALFLAGLKILMPCLFVFPGILCFLLFRDQATPDTAYMVLVKHLMPTGLLGLSMAALIAALIDTVSSGLNSFSTVFTLDVVGRLRTMDERQSRLAGRVITVIAAVLALLIAVLFSYSGKGFFELTQGLVSILAPPLSVVFLAGALWKKANHIAAEWVLYGGGLVCLVIGACYVLNYPGPHFWPGFLMLSFYLFVGLLAAMIVISLATTPRIGSVLPSLSDTYARYAVRSQRVWVAWGLLGIIMIFIYAFFE
ncbi:sodium:solute symporter family transporter [Dinghuibacter silviterrae]|uniref:SSS family solute:Na+ symporter n=1 Tax=Dinghuibacter silviterrae TaxID=1539049 RepID=A0A4R8DFQ7_9BACT|nr:sodium/solute symporter [Dinghuibacter silviterrae]TDW95926.1 SSS family solute:Na+ symporter [Dinghuibacter silviterrae]